MVGKHVGIFDAVVLGGDAVAQIVAEFVAPALILLGLAGQTTCRANDDAVGVHGLPNGHLKVGLVHVVGVCATKEA